MKIFTNQDIRRLFAGILIVTVIVAVLSPIIVWAGYGIWLPIISVPLFLSGGFISAICYSYFRRQNQIIEEAASQIEAFLAGDTNARIGCDNEGEIYKLFHSVNTLVTVLNAHSENELRSKEFLKNTISDISHQLKTPLAALNIYNGLLQDETDSIPSVKEFVDLSEHEIDRIETLVQNLLKIARLDAGTIITEMVPENVSDMMNDIGQHFEHRANQEHKEMILKGPDDVILLCDRDWMIEAISNIVKNAFDHTESGGHITIEWKQMPDLVQLSVKDDGSGIHPEDIYYIFKRFYRSRFSKDTQGVGLGLPLAKTIIELHNGNITVDSILGQGSIFTVNFLITTKL